MLSTKLSPYLKNLSKQNISIKKQFVPSNKEEKDEEITVDDPLLEEEHTAVKGLVHKYPNRALVLLTMNCAAYCRFCTRRRRVSHIEKGKITEVDLNRMVMYLKQHPDIKELIISGGDPLTVPETLKMALKKFSSLPQIKILRVGTRLPISNPNSISSKVIEALNVVKKQPLYLMLHFEHPSEITPQVEKAIKKLRTVSTAMFSQSVFLKGVNDNVETLAELFTKLIEIGIKPYYMYRCDYVRGAEHFIVDFQKEITIMTELRKRLSGLAFPIYAVDAQGGAGKIPVPLNYWQFESDKYKDFEDKEIEILK